MLQTEPIKYENGWLARHTAHLFHQGKCYCINATSNSATDVSVPLYAVAQPRMRIVLDTL